MFIKGQKVIHPLYGIGEVEKIEKKVILGQTTHFSTVSFQSNRLKMMINLNQKNNLIRCLISKDEVPKVLKFMRKCQSNLTVKSSERYNINLKKIKTSNIYQLAEVIKDLTDLSRIKKLTPKEQEMLKQSKNNLSLEFSLTTDLPQEKTESMIEKVFKN